MLSFFPKFFISSVCLVLNLQRPNKTLHSAKMKYVEIRVVPSSRFAPLGWGLKRVKSCESKGPTFPLHATGIHQEIASAFIGWCINHRLIPKKNPLVRPVLS